MLLTISQPRNAVHCNAEDSPTTGNQVHLLHDLTRLLRRCTCDSNLEKVHLIFCESNKVEWKLHFATGKCKIVRFLMYIISKWGYKIIACYKMRNQEEEGIRKSDNCNVAVVLNLVEKSNINELFRLTKTNFKRCSGCE